MGRLGASTTVPPDAITARDQEGEDVAPASPTVARWELALRLKRRREELGLTVKQITDELGFTRNYWSQVEHEKTVLAADKLTALGALFRFDDATLAELHELRTVARQRGWWADYADQLDDEMQRFFGLEQGATAIRNFESLLIPGLLQTERYARAVFRVRPRFPPRRHVDRAGRDAGCDDSSA